MGSADIWKPLFQNWPAGLNKKGIVVNNLGEAMPFKAFMLAAEYVLLERTNPDTLGSRYIIVPFGEIACLKFVDPASTKTFAGLGLEGALTT